MMQTESSHAAGLRDSRIDQGRPRLPRVDTFPPTKAPRATLPRASGAAIVPFLPPPRAHDTHSLQHVCNTEDRGPLARWYATTLLLACINTGMHTPTNYCQT
jgi:hypothetical protein